MDAVVIVPTASGATYVLAPQHGGRPLVRLPAPSGMSWTASGSEEYPRVVKGEHLLIGSRVTRVEVLLA